MWAYVDQGPHLHVFTKGGVGLGGRCDQLRSRFYLRSMKIRDLDGLVSLKEDYEGS